MVHTILGAGGSIGNALSVELIKQKENIRLVSRSGFRLANTESYKADLLKKDEVIESIKGSNIVYLVAGLKYDSRVWAESWPVIMNNVIEACKKENCKLIFFDNVYMYGKVTGKMTEETPYNPSSKKGEVRAKIAQHLEEEMRNGMNALIARAADLYGPFSTSSSMMYIMVFDKLLKNKKANWLSNAKVQHTFTYTSDCGEALYLLSKEEKAKGVWHLPTYNPGMTGEEIIKYSASLLQSRSDYMVLNKIMIKMAGLFNTTIKELIEMLYQNEFAYQFDSTKFEKYFNYKPTSYEAGIKETLKHLTRDRK